MDRPGRIFGALAALLLACATVFAALGSHYPLLLEPARAHLWQIALEFHWFHALLFLILASLPKSPWLSYASGLYILGILFFCCNMYAKAIWGHHPLSPLIPVGGVCFILGHGSLLFHFLFGIRNSP